MFSLILAAALLADPISTEVVMTRAPAALHATLLTPEGPTRAAALIIAGSGPTDRDGNSPLGVSSSSYRLLAEGLAEQGIASLRADKRGIGASAYPGMAEADLLFTDYSNDAGAWAAETARLTGQPCAWLIGHSEGALVALAAVANGDDAVCGLVLLAGAGRPIGAVLREQLANAPEPLRSQAVAILAELEAGRPVTDVPPQLAALFRPSVQPYMISWLPLDPAALVAAYPGPVMIGQGTADIQVGLTDAEALAAARPGARLAIWEGVSHLLKLAPADRAANIATYSDPTLPLAPGVVEDVAGFILERR
ncbi:MAG: alpha/beta hydrolase [Brevundimonas sp.]|uniref:alpha/beta hydrolase n=1 Tax=Brevundimonas sp. TaxID=1871086 RepID=UPI002723F281|nr:alpha/beta hydrolase [Brevundimonas sp.]MDO9077732.1 alpha/beta hydrolase [Brevundimonas sp.]MDP3081077.1 alpha/beta hydrolase [Brevundimonas sp.]MDZ4062911.1 alpha/beta hydrolase [Brevundimonas sp.]